MSKVRQCGKFRKRWLAWTLCVLPLAAMGSQPGNSDGTAADSATTSPSVPRDVTAPSDPLDDKPGTGQLRARLLRPTPDQWQDAIAFLSQYSPKRMALIKELPEGKARLLKFTVYQRYLKLQQLKDSFPALYDLGIKRLAIEDTLFDLRSKYKTASSADQPAILSDMRKQVGALFDNLQQDRKARIERMQMYIAELQNKYDNDAGNRDQVIEKNLNTVIKTGAVDFSRMPKALRKSFGGKNSPGNAAEVSPPISGSSTPTTNP